MKLSKFFLLLFAIGLVLQSCSNHNELEGDEQDVEGYFEFKAVFDDSNKTRNDYSETEFGFKNTWEVGDLIRIYTTNGAGLVAEFILDPASDGQTVGTFKSNGLAKLTDNAKYRAVALSAAKAATLANTNYPAQVDTPYFMIQTGNESIKHIAHESILRSTNNLTVSQPTSGTLPTTPAEPGTPGMQADGSYFMGTYVFNISDFAVLAVQFTLPDEEAVTKAVSFTLNSASAAPVAFVLEMDDITAGQPITAYTIVPNGTPLAGGSVDIGVGTNKEYYQYLQNIAKEAPATAQGGTRYMKILDNADISENPAFYLRALEANIQAANGYAYNGTNLPYKTSGNATNALNLNYGNTIINLINNNEITILDDATPALNLYTPGIRCAFNARTTNIDVIFPHIVVFPDGNATTSSYAWNTRPSSTTSVSLSYVSHAGIVGTSVGAGCFRDVTKISGMDAPNCTKIGAYAFKNCQELLDTNFPLVETVNTSAFEQCTALKVLNLPEAVTISGFGLYGINNIEELYLPKVKSFGGWETKSNSSRSPAISYAVRMQPAFGVDNGTVTAPLKMVLGTKLAKGTVTSTSYNAFENRNIETIELELGECFATGTNSSQPVLKSYRGPLGRATSGASASNDSPSTYKVTVDDTYSSETATDVVDGHYWWTRSTLPRFGYTRRSETDHNLNCDGGGTNCYNFLFDFVQDSDCEYGPFRSIKLQYVESETIEGESGAGNGNGGIFKPGGGF